MNYGRASTTFAQQAPAGTIKDEALPFGNPRRLPFKTDLWRNIGSNILGFSDIETRAESGRDLVYFQSQLEDRPTIYEVGKALS